MSFYKSAVAGATAENVNKPFGIKDKLAYAAGDVGCNMSFALNSYLLYFWTEYMGISMAHWAIIILALKIWDAINDPVIGGLMDAMKPKPGQSKFKPWIFWGSLVLIFSGALCFVPIPSAPYAVKIVICVVGYLLWDMSYTVVNVPYGSLNSVISTNGEERAALSTFRSLGAFAANIVLMMVIPALAYDTAGRLQGEIMIIIGAVAGVCGFFMFQFLCRGTTERVVVDYEAQKKEANQNYFKSLGAFLKNRAAVALTLAAIFQLMATAFMSALSSIYIRIAFPQFSQMSGIISLFSFLPMFVAIPFITKAVKKWGKRDASAWPYILGIIGGVLLLAVPAEKTPGIAGLILWMLPALFVGLSIAVNSLVGWAMVADCIDYQEVRTGVREEGVVYATYSLGRKLAQGFGASLVAALLGLTGYVAENMNAGIPQAPGTDANIRMLLGAAYLICFAGMFVLTKFVYPLGKKEVAEVTAKLGRDNNNLIGKNDEE